MVILVTDGHLPVPYGHETMGYGVADLVATIAKAKAAGATLLIGPTKSDDRNAAMLRFPGGVVVEIHAAA